MDLFLKYIPEDVSFRFLKLLCYFKNKCKFMCKLLSHDSFLNYITWGISLSFGKPKELNEILSLSINIMLFKF